MTEKPKTGRKKAPGEEHTLDFDDVAQGQPATENELESFAPPTADLPDMLAGIDQLTPEQIDAMIRKRLEEGGGLLFPEDDPGLMMEEDTPTQQEELVSAPAKEEPIDPDAFDRMIRERLPTAGSLQPEPLSKPQETQDLGGIGGKIAAGPPPEAPTRDLHAADPPLTSEAPAPPTGDFRLSVAGPMSAGPLPSGDELPASSVKPLDPMTGKVIAGRFKIVDLLGKGGMGKVYKAEQMGLGREVALKLLHPHLASEKESKARFHREAQSMSRLSHPGITSIYDFGEWDGQFYIAMELLKGIPLNKRIPKYKSMPPAEIVPLLSQTCDALAAAHEIGLIHRDLKPENIVLQEDGTIKLVDFGLAILKDTSEEERLTLEGMTIGTPHYMSPEQCQGMEVDPRTDIYALGCILYEMLCGDIPFVGDSLMSIMMQQLFAEPVLPSQRKGGADAHPALEALAMKALSKDPEGRPGTVQLFQEALIALDESKKGPERAGQEQLIGRNERASAMGLPHITGRITRAPTKFADVLFLVLEHPEHYTESLTMHMWSNGFTVKQLESFTAVKSDIGSLSPAALILDLRSDPEALFGQLKEAMGEGVLGEAAVILVGPDEDMSLMTRSLELGVFDYVPGGSARQKLPKSLRRIARKKARKGKKPD